MRGGSTLDVFQSAGAGECFNNLLRPMLKLIGAVEKEVMSGATLRETNSGRAQALRERSRGEDPILSEPVTPSAGDQGQGRERQELGVRHPLQVERRQARVSANRCERDTNTRPLPRLAAASSLVLPCADGPRLGERQAAVGQDQRRAADDLIPQFRSCYTNPGSYEIYKKTGEFPGRGRSSRHASRRKISTRLSYSRGSMIDHSRRRASRRSRTPCISLSRARCANFAPPVVQAATALIADTATERGLEVSAE
jgi:hypothetical protein